MNTFLIIYASGFITSYILLRIYVKIVDGKIWSKTMRIKGIAISLLSWLAVLVSTISFIREYDNDEAASW